MTADKTDRVDRTNSKAGKQACVNCGKRTYDSTVRNTPDGRVCPRCWKVIGP